MENTKYNLVVVKSDKINSGIVRYNLLTETFLLCQREHP